MFRILAMATGLLLGAIAQADDSATPPLPAPPTVNYAMLGDGATVRPVNRDGKPHQAVSHLVTDKSTIKNGEMFRIGIHLDPDENWHTYWKSPGGVGMPTNIDWSLPDGTVVNAHAYPSPQKFSNSGIVSYGYEDQVLLISEVTLPPGTATGPITLKARADWLVCESSCIPSGDVHLHIDLIVGDATVASPMASLFDHYQAHHPVEALGVSEFAFEPALDKTAIKLWENHQVAFLLTPTGEHPLKIPADGRPAFIPIANAEQWYTEKAVVHELPDGKLLAVFSAQGVAEDLPQDAPIGGLFQVQVGDKVIRTEFMTQFPWVGEDAEVTDSSSPVFALIPGAEAATDATDAHPTENPTTDAAAAQVAPQGEATLIASLFGAFFGGLLLNIMPCVLPVLTLKLFSLVAHSEQDSSQQMKAGLAYTAGILVSFWALAAGVIAVKAAIGGVGWGFQFQSPLYVVGLGTIVFAFGLSMFGVFEVPAFGSDAASNAAHNQSGLMQDFMFGALATLLATPCTAPLLGPAIGFALGQSAPMIVLFFSLIGLGLASPFLLVAFFPASIRFLPQPGEWMDTFKQFMGFTLIATTIWMIDVLTAQIGPDGAIGYLVFLMFVAIGCWIFGTWGGLAETRARQAQAFMVAICVMALGGWGFLDLTPEEPVECNVEVTEVVDFSHEIPWQPFNAASLATLEGETIFVDFTADWCLTCKVNENTILETETVRQAMKANNIVPLKADWTRRDAYITEWLAKFGRAGVPFYIVIPGDGGEPFALPDVLTTDRVVSALKKGAGND